MTVENQHYENLVRILQEAGFLFFVRNEQCEIAGDNIAVANPNLVARKCNDDHIIATVDEVTVHCGKEKLSIKDIDADQGVIVLADVPEEAVDVRVFYSYSTIELDFLEIVRDDVEGLINSKLRSLGRCANLRSAISMNKLRVITRLWAGGLLLSREYGYNTDSEQTSKDGYRKIQEAKSMLNELCDELSLECGQSDTNGGAECVISSADDSLFDEPPKVPRNGSEW